MRVVDDLRVWEDVAAFSLSHVQVSLEAILTVWMNVEAGWRPLIQMMLGGFEVSPCWILMVVAAGKQLF